MISIFLYSSFVSVCKFSSRIGMMFLSISIVSMLWAFLASSCVKMPSPGPISTMLSVPVISAVSVMRFKTFSSIKKFCPKCFFAKV